MPRRTVPPIGHGLGANGLRALADLVNEVLRSWDTGRPGAVLAVAVPQPAGGPLVFRTAVDDATTQEGRSRLRARGSRALPPTRPQRGRNDSADDDHDVAEEHAETWRLVRRAQDGDGEAFGLLYDRYVDSVFRFVYYRVNDRALAEDFTSETFVRALRRIGTISYQGRDIGAWFVTIARNIVFDHMKSARTRVEVTTGDTVEPREHSRSTESAVLDTLTAERLMAAVGELGEEQRECVMLRFMQGLSVAETASVMGKNDGAIKALQHRAVRKLADLVGDELR